MNDTPAPLLIEFRCYGEIIEDNPEAVAVHMVAFDVEFNPYVFKGVGSDELNAMLEGALIQFLVDNRQGVNVRLDYGAP